MTKEEKELLLKDLCTRLPYGVVCGCSYNKENGSSDRVKICSEGILQLNADVLSLFIEDEINLLPYLRPISSMTEEEIEIFNSDFGGIDNSYNSIEVKRIDWLIKNHLDYRGLIPMSLALPAPEGMYKIE